MANHAKDFLRFCLQNFDCYWLTTHCRGSKDTVIDYLTPYSDAEFLSLVEQIKVTDFRTFKTEALTGDFIWVDDSPTAYELLELERTDKLNRWFQVNTRNNIDDLHFLIDSLKKVINNELVL